MKYFVLISFYGNNCHAGVKNTTNTATVLNDAVIISGGIYMNHSKYRIPALILVLAIVLSAGAFALANDTPVEINPRPNTAPIAENMELETFRGVEAHGRFKALDPDGDLLTFEITTVPKKGSVTPGTGATFTYTPSAAAKGKDSFSYVAVDSNGAVSGAATITIDIKKQNCKTTYSDMDGNSAHYAALVLSEAGIFTGEQLGNEYLFRPAETVTRGEFLAMCLKLNETEPISGITRTGFFDDDSIPMWVKPYVSAAVMGGLITGSRSDDGQLVFNSGDAITFAEAAVILNNTLGITDVLSVSATIPENVPAWAASAASNLTACNILPTGLAGIADKTLTRANAAEMLLASARVITSRTGGGGLLSWAK